MSILYDAMTIEQQLLCGQVMDRYAEWLNLWHVEVGEDTRVTREMFFESNDPPCLALDVETEALWNNRLIIFVMTPYHDEGGPAAMTCYFRHETLFDADSPLLLTHVTQEFDTMLQTIYDTTNDSRPEANPFFHTPQTEGDGS